MQTRPSKGTLYIVSTPIGNLKDITLRAVETLRKSDLIAAEDTRHTRILADHYGIRAPMTSYFSHSGGKKADYLIRVLKEGKDVALVSDAGTPGISDPGFAIIKKAVDEDIRVVPVPGPAAFLTALSASGLPTNKFVFEGFLSNKGSQRRRRLKALSAENRTIIIYESPHRLLKTLGDMLEILGDIQVVCARELTKKFEEIRREKVSESIRHFSNTKVRGEFIIIFHPRA